VTVEDVLGVGLGMEVFERLSAHFGEAAQVRVARTQVTFARRRGFAFLWSPQRWQGGRAAPLVLTLALREPDHSQRWKEVYQVRPELWNHHLEIRAADEIDHEVLHWLNRAWEQAA
jgi:hypothetical protein